MQINSPKFYSELIHALDQLKSEITDDCLAFEFDETPGLQVTLACSDNGDEYALQVGDNSFTGCAYGFPHWSVGGLYKDSDTVALSEDLIHQLNELIRG